MPHALLLSPDDQAVAAITGVLEEMSVTCERPLDGVSAAQKLNSQSFDLVLVDCENLPAAKLIFDVCRRGKNGNNPVPIAIVDGRAGLPTAFRLGAELILTKPVAKDQARSTIRTAVSRVRRSVQSGESATAQASSAATTAAATAATAAMADSAATGSMATDSAVTEERAFAAAAGVSSQLTSFDEPVPSFIPTSVPASAPSSVPNSFASAALAATLSAAAVPSVKPEPAFLSAPSQLEKSFESSATQSTSIESKPPLRPSDDPVLAELERTELEESEQAKSQPAPVAAAPVATPRRKAQGKTRAPLVALVLLALVGSGFYAAWLTQPGFRTTFRTMVQPQIDRGMALVGMALPPDPTPHPAQLAAKPAPAKIAVPVLASTDDPNKSASAAPGSATAAGGSPTDTPIGLATDLPAGSPAGSPTTSAASSASRKPSAAQGAALISSSAELPGEKSAIILSSKGAASLLVSSVAPKYPVEGRSQGASEKVVLKAVVDENGQVEGVRLVEGNATLAPAAIQAVKLWRYRPYVHDGKAQSFQTVVIVDVPQP
jgi:TonB family protein